VLTAVSEGVQGRGTEKVAMDGDVGGKDVACRTDGTLMEPSDTKPPFACLHSAFLHTGSLHTCTSLQCQRTSQDSQEHLSNTGHPPFLVHGMQGDARGCKGMQGDARGCKGMQGNASECKWMHGDAWGCMHGGHLATIP